MNKCSTFVDIDTESEQGILIDYAKDRGIEIFTHNKHIMCCIKLTTLETWEVISGLIAAMAMIANVDAGQGFTLNNQPIDK